LILESMLPSPSTWNNIYPIPNAEVVAILYCCYKTFIDLGTEKLNYCGTKCIFTHILKLGMYFAITLSVNGQSPKHYYTLVTIPITEMDTITYSCYKTFIDLKVHLR
jgi:hypothetical protein